MKENKKKLGKNAEMELDEAQIENVSGGEGVATAGLVSSNVGVTGLEINPATTIGGDVKASANLINIETIKQEVIQDISGAGNVVQNTISTNRGG